MPEPLPSPQPGKRFNRVAFWRPLFRRVKALTNMEIRPRGFGKLTVAGDKAVLSFEPDQLGEEAADVRMVLVDAPASPGKEDEIKDAIEDAYIGTGTSASPQFTPRVGDLLYWTDSRYRFTVAPGTDLQGNTILGDEKNRIVFTVDEKSYSALLDALPVHTEDWCEPETVGEADKDVLIMRSEPRDKETPE